MRVLIECPFVCSRFLGVGPLLGEKLIARTAGPPLPVRRADGGQIDTAG
jgi:hypothetical protein